VSVATVEQAFQPWHGVGRVASGTGTLMFCAGEINASGTPVDGTRTTVGLSGWNAIVLIS
jgi:hypothetical protein